MSAETGSWPAEIFNPLCVFTELMKLIRASVFLNMRRVSGHFDVTDVLVLNFGQSPELRRDFCPGLSSFTNWSWLFFVLFTESVAELVRNHCIVCIMTHFVVFYKSGWKYELWNKRGPRRETRYSNLVEVLQSRFLESSQPIVNFSDVHWRRRRVIVPSILFPEDRFRTIKHSITIQIKIHPKRIHRLRKPVTSWAILSRSSTPEIHNLI